MSLTPSTMLDLGSPAPHFILADTEGNIVSIKDFGQSKALLVAFICNHCPYVIHIKSALSAFATEYSDKGLAVVAINSNDAEKYADDSPEKMKQDVERLGYTFPYLYDQTQQVAKNYLAACTPDFFLFNQDRKLVYRGQFDGSRPGNDIPVSGIDLRRAVEAVLTGNEITEQQKPSLGCNIKWKPGNEPKYYAHQ